MWLFTVHGFYSIVQKDDHWHIRARAKRDLENLKRVCGLRSKLKIEESWPGSDYPWRMLVSRAAKDAIIQTLGSGIDYSNFKAEVGRRADQSHKLPAYHEIWAIMAAQ